MGHEQQHGNDCHRRTEHPFNSRDFLGPPSMQAWLHKPPRKFQEAMQTYLLFPCTASETASVRK